MVFNTIRLNRGSSLLMLGTIALSIYIATGFDTSYLMLALFLPMASLTSLLLLNTIVLVIYLKYFVSPYKEQQVENFRPLRFTHKSIWPRLEKIRATENQPVKEKSLSSDDPEIDQAFNHLLNLVIRDFITSWFVKITGTLEEQTFPLAVHHIIHSAVIQIRDRLKNTDLLMVILNKIIPRMTLHISEFRTAETNLRGKSLERSVTQSDELDLLLASRFRQGKLHKALTSTAVTTKPTEIAYLRHLIERVLPLIIEKKELQSGPVRVVIREIVSNLVLQPVLDMLADPDFWNQTIDTYLGKAIIEQKMVRQLREVLNRHSTNEIDADEVMSVFNDTTLFENATSQNRNSRSNSKMSQSYSGKRATNSQSSHFTEWEGNGQNEEDEETDLEVDLEQEAMLKKNKFYNNSSDYDSSSFIYQKKKQYGLGSVKMGRRVFQNFLKTIQEEKNLLDLKRVRIDIVTQIKKKKAQIAERNPEEDIDGDKVKDVLVYIDNLSIAKKRVDKRIAALSGEHYDFKKSTSQLFGSKKQSVAPPTRIGYSLKEILTNTAGLSYFMEFMDRRGDMVKLQFWLMVEGFNSTDSANTTRNDEQKTFLQDVKMVYEIYFTEYAAHRLSIPKNLDLDLKKAILSASKPEENEDKFTDQIDELRTILCQVQKHVFWEIEKEHFSYFKRSDLYFKFLSSAPPIIPENTLPAEILDTITTPPPRRSLDESTFYNNNSGSIRLSRSASIHDTSSIAILPPPAAPAAAITSSLPVDSDFDLSALNKQLKSLPSSSTSKSSESHYGRLRGHQRAMSDSVKSLPAASRFLSFSNMFTSNRLWNNNPETTGRVSSSVPSSIKSLEEYSDVTDDHKGEAEEEEYQEPIESSRKKNILVRSNTVDAVEAELRSILDGSNNTDSADDGEENTKTKPITAAKATTEEPEAPLTTTKRPNIIKPSPSTSALLLRGTKGIKSATAVPVENAYALPSWTSSGGTNAISEIKHDTLESVASLASSVPAKREFTGKAHSIKEEEEEVTTSALASQKQALLLENSMNMSDTSSSNIHFAPPGDLMLAAKIDQLAEEIEKLTAQEAIVDALINKTESQNKVEELRILKKSKTMFRQELQQIKYQKSQYELQESENVLMPDRSQVNITSATIGSDKHGDFALYVIEIQQLGLDGNYASGWIVARRYSEFFSLYQKLKDTYPIVKLIEFPSKWPLLKLQRPFVEARRISLERFLRNLIKDKDICKSQEFRSFLSQQNIYVPGPDTEWPFGSVFASGASQHQPQQNIQTSSSSSSLQSLSTPSVQNLQKSIALANEETAAIASNLQKKHANGFMRHIYKTVAAGIDDMLVGPSMLDMITQRLGEQVMGFTTEDDNNKSPSPPNSSSSSRSKNLESSTNDIGNNSMNASVAASDIPESLKAEGITRFTEPLCDMFIEMFELKDKTNWLRRQAIVIILQQILEGTIERRLREFMKYMSSSSMIIFYFNKITDSLWPNGGTLAFKEPRKIEDKIHTREEANRKLSTWLPDLLGNMVGRQNARKGARRLFTVLQNKRLNQDLIYTLLDETVCALFPELLTNNDTTNKIN